MMKVDKNIDSSKTVIKANFIGKFKIGDNICYNMKCLNQLYKLKSKYVIKIKIVIMASIVEAIIYDLLIRGKQNVHEGVDNIDQDVVDNIKKIKVEKIKYLVTSLKDVEFFKGVVDDKTYDDLDRLFALRNRIHIQNEYSKGPTDEVDLFNEDSLDFCESFFKTFLKICEDKFTRKDKNTHHVADFIIPF